MVRILNFSSFNIDMVYTLDHVALTGESEEAVHLATYPGGKGLNHSVAAAKAGGRVYNAGCIGSDGKIFTDIMLESGVDMSYMKAVDEKSGHAVIQVTHDGENSVIIYGGANKMFTKSYIDAVLAEFSENDILLLQNEINLVDYIVNKAHERGMRIFFNASPVNAELKNVNYDKITYLVINRLEAKELTGTDDPEASLMYLLRAHPRLRIILTLGKNGCVYADEKTRIYHPAFKVDVVDTTAAGTVFAGYFVAAIADGRDESYAVRLASAAAAISVSRRGAVPSIPDRLEVETALEMLKADRTGNDDENRKKQIKGYIETHIVDASLDDLAAVLGYSAVYTSALVKKLAGKTFSVLLQEKRCELSAKLLKETDMPIDEIIYSVGYENESFFRRIFKERYGVSPLKYRVKSR